MNVIACRHLAISAIPVLINWDKWDSHDEIYENIDFCTL